jgi:peptidoglycan/xylan/chitin deacetylase (PgdA/CDA1 family)
VTPWVLDVLDKYQIKATFFMVGDNVRKHPDEFREVLRRGHRVGNHTFNHIRGFEHKAESYLENAEKVRQMALELEKDEALLDKAMRPPLFRPPHGYMGPRQFAALRKFYKIVMWDLVTRDYSKRLNGEQVFNKVKKYVRNGSIITFHDSLKSWNKGNLQYALPRAIEYLQAEGYEFKLI